MISDCQNCSLHDAAELFLDVPVGLLVLLLVLDGRDEEVVEFLADAVEGLLALLAAFHHLLLGHVALVEEDLVAAVLVGGAVLLVDHGDDVVLALVGSGLVGVVGVTALHPHRLIQRRHHHPTVHPRHRPVLELLLGVLLRHQRGLVLELLLLVQRVELRELQRARQLVREAARQEVGSRLGLLAGGPAHHVLHGLVLHQQVHLGLVLPLREARLVGVDAVPSIHQKPAFGTLTLEALSGFELETVDLEDEFAEALEVCELGVVGLKPELEVGQDAANHGQFPLVGVRQVDLDVVLAHVGVDPGHHFLARRREDHVLVDDEESVVLGQGETGVDDGAGVPQTPFRSVGFFQPRNRLALQIVSPYFLTARLRLPQDYLRGPLHPLLLPFTIQFPLFLRLDRNPMANSIVLFHQQKQILKPWPPKTQPLPFSSFPSRPQSISKPANPRRSSLLHITPSLPALPTQPNQPGSSRPFPTRIRRGTRTGLCFIFFSDNQYYLLGLL